MNQKNKKYLTKSIDKCHSVSIIILRGQYDYLTIIKEENNGF